MNIETRDEGTVTVFSLQGKIMNDIDVKDFMDTLKATMADGRFNIVLDFGEVDWINSSGLGMLIAAQDVLREMNGTLRLASLNESVIKLIHVNRLNQILHISPTVSAAIESFHSVH